MKLLVYERSFNRLQGRIMAVAPDIEPLILHDDGSVSADGLSVDRDTIDCEIVWGSSDLYIGGPAREAFQIFRNLKNLKWFQSGAAGFDHPVFAEIAATGAVMTRSNAQGIAIAEYIFARVFEVFQRAEERREAQREKKWRRFPFSDMYGKTWLIIGMGAIGNETAKRAKAFGARVIGVRRSPTGEEAADEMITPQGLYDALPQADIVVLTTPLTDDTRHMVDRKFLEAMRLKSVLVNVGRGGLVNEPALLASMDHGRPGAAILDVFEHEPLPPDSPLWDYPGILITAHCAADSPLTTQRGDDLFIDNLERYITGRPLRLVVEGLAAV